MRKICCILYLAFVYRYRDKIFFVLQIGEKDVVILGTFYVDPDSECKYSILNIYEPTICSKILDKMYGHHAFL